MKDREGANREGRCWMGDGAHKILLSEIFTWEICCLTYQQLTRFANHLNKDQREWCLVIFAFSRGDFKLKHLMEFRCAINLVNVTNDFVGVRKKAELVKTFDKLGVMYKNSSKWEERSEDARGFIL